MGMPQGDHLTQKTKVPLRFLSLPESFTGSALHLVLSDRRSSLAHLDEQNDRDNDWCEQDGWPTANIKPSAYCYPKNQPSVRSCCRGQAYVEADVRLPAIADNPGAANAQLPG
jgi:hypothetical protein